MKTKIKIIIVIEIINTYIYKYTTKKKKKKYYKKKKKKLIRTNCLPIIQTVLIEKWRSHILNKLSIDGPNNSIIIIFSVFFCPKYKTFGIPSK